MEFPVLLAGKTYDLKRFLHDHPGGVNTIKHYKGKSILQAMEKFEHSASAYHMLRDFKVDDKVRIEDSNLTGGVSANGRVITTRESNRDVEEIKFLEELENRLDWSKPLLPQLDLIAPHYNLWVHSAVYRKCRLFANPILESMTYTPWYLVPLVWLPTILYLGCMAYMDYVGCEASCPDPMSTYRFIYHLLMGVLIWTSLEYTLHRWVFHLDPGNNLTMIKTHFLIHGLHHKMPFDGLRQVFPPVPAAMIVCVLYLILSYIVTYPSIKLVGGLAGYLTYDMIHVYVHRGSPKDGTYLYKMKRYHSNHHFVNHDKAFGISSNIWDHVFRTFVNVKKLGFSLRW